MEGLKGEADGMRWEGDKETSCGAETPYEVGGECAWAVGKEGILGAERLVRVLPCASDL